MARNIVSRTGDRPLELQQSLEELQRGMARVPEHLTGTTFPVAPQHGDLFFYDAGDGITWQFMYNSAGTTYLWEYVGGPPLIGLDNDQRTRTNTAYGAPPTDPITVTIPLAGDYDIDYQVSGLSATGFDSAYYSYSVGATAANDNWACVAGLGVGYQTMLAEYRHAGVAAAASITEAWRASAGNATAEDRRLRVRPVRV